MSHLKAIRFSLAFVLGIAASAMAQQPQPQAPPPLTMKQLKPDVWVGLGGAGGNSTISSAKRASSSSTRSRRRPARRICLAEIAKITPKPVTTAFVTHSDGDHVNGLVAFPPAEDHRARGKQQEGAGGRAGRRRPRRAAPRPAAEPGRDEEQGNDDD